MPHKSKRRVRLAKDRPRIRFGGGSVVTLKTAPASGDGQTQSKPTFEMIAYTGSVMTASGFGIPIILEMGGIRAARPRVPILLGHDFAKIVGMGEVRVTQSNVTVSGQVTADNESSREVIAQAEGGFEWQASLGADIIRQEFLRSGNVASVNGREVRGPAYLIREASIFEVSFTPVGADGQTSAAVAAELFGGIFNRGEINMEFDDWLRENGFDPATITANQRAVLQASFDASRGGAGRGGSGSGDDDEDDPPEDHGRGQGRGRGRGRGRFAGRGQETLDEIVERRMTDQRRRDTITAMADREMGENPWMTQEITAMARAAIADGSSPETFELAILRASRYQGGPSGYVTGRPKDVDGRVVEATIALANGIRNPEKHYDEKTLNLSYDKFPRGFKLGDFFIMCARSKGYQGNSTTDIEGILRAAFTPPNQVRATAFSTLEISGILANVANKFLAQGFESVESTWEQIAGFRNVNDFKQITSYALTGDMTYKLMGPGGSIPHGTLGEESYTNRARNYARMLAITYEDIINDDLGALTRVPFLLGRGASQMMNEVFWTAFLAGVGSFWAAGNNNLITGAGSALSVAGLKSAHNKFRKQTDPKGEPFGVLPKILLVPPELELTAEELMTSIGFNAGSDLTDSQAPNRNIFINKYRVVGSSYLSNANYTGYSTTGWYLLADPNDAVTIEVALLFGRRQPVIESADADFHQLGIQYRGYHAFGASLQEKRGSVRAAGA